MYAIIDAAILHSRTTLCILLMIILTGLVSRGMIPVESEPEVVIPIVLVTIPHPGISPEDGERLISRPMENELRSLEGLEEITSYSREGLVAMVLEFDVSFDIDSALVDVREAVDRAQVEIPSTTEEPLIEEVSATDFPTIVISLAAEHAPERLLYNLAIKLRDELESISYVREARLSGHREELLEAVINPSKLESYGISQQALINAVVNNNSLIAAGAMDTGQGRFAVKVPGLIETHQDVFNLPLKSTENAVVTVADVADIRRTFKDRENYTRVNGKPALSIEVLKRPGSNQIATNAAVRELVERVKQDFPPGVEVIYSQDQAPFAAKQVEELQGNILTAMALVMTLVVAALGLRSGLLVGASIPVSFLFALILLNYIGYSFNFMVMFGMLLALGMLIDGAIVVTEYADRKMVEGQTSLAAYRMAAKRMFWPVTASTATTLAAFLPLFLWPGVSGQFMLYLPVTAFTVLVGSLFYALFFGPTLGAMLGKAGAVDEHSLRQMYELEHGDPKKMSGLTGIYARFLYKAVNYPLATLAVTIFVLYMIFDLYGRYGTGMEFFTETDPSFARVSVNARGNLSKVEIRDLVLEVEQKILEVDGIHSVFTATTGGGGGGFMMRSSAPADQVGVIFMEMENRYNPTIKGKTVLENVRKKLGHLAGITIEIQQEEGGPPTGKDVQLQLSSKYREALIPAATQVREYFNTLDGLREIEDTRPLPGIEWKLEVDRAQAALFGANVNVVGGTVQFITNGMYLGEYRPDDAEEEVEIRVRYPETQRNIDVLDELRISTQNGQVPISNFVVRKARNKVDSIQRIDGYYVMFVRANVLPGIVVDNKVQEIQTWLEQTELDPRIITSFRGAAEEQAESMQFIGFAFLMALLLMFVLLVTQFNSFYQSGLILSAVVMSTAGVLLGLLITQQTFSAILTGVGIVALAGIVVNNNIVLIDTFNHVKREHPDLSIEDVIVKTGAQRLRPVFLTTATTILGLLPIATHTSIDFINREIVSGSIVSQFWVKLASSIVNGLTFATLLTLIVTPVMLILPYTAKRTGRVMLKRLMWLRQKQDQPAVDLEAK